MYIYGVEISIFCTNTVEDTEILTTMSSGLFSAQVHVINSLNLVSGRDNLYPLLLSK